jgi:hypothetical protein
MTIHKPPKPLGDANAHYWMVQKMARATGVDLATEAAEGRLSHDDWATMLHRCRGCSWERDGGCSRWMEITALDGQQDVPSACENVDTFRAFAAPADAKA